MIRRWISLVVAIAGPALGVVLIALFSSCEHSPRIPGPITAPGPSTVVVSLEPADHPDYLCDGDEDEVQINQAIAAAASAGGGTVLLRTGTFHVRTGVLLKSGVTLRGAGPATVIALQDNAPSMLSTAGIIRLKDDTQRGTAKRVQHVTLQDFVVDGNRANQSTVADEKKFGVYCEGDYITMQRVIARHCAGYGFDPHAFADTIPTAHLTIDACESYDNQLDGFALDMIVSATVTRAYAHHNDRHGFNVISGTTGTTLSHCRSVGNQATGLTLQDGAQAVTVKACEFTDNALGGIVMRAADGCVVSGNTVRNNARSGIVLRGTDGTTLSANTLIDDSFGSADYPEILLDNYLSDDASNDRVISNAITSATASAGVLEAGAADYNRVENNIIAVPARHVVLIGPNSTQSGNSLR